MVKGKRSGKNLTKEDKEENSFLVHQESLPISVSFEKLYTVKASSRDGSNGRRNVASTITRSDRFVHIENGVSPFLYGSTQGNYSSNISIKDAVVLCQKAYWNFSIFRNTIDLMTEFAVSPIYFAGGNVESRNFFNSWAKKINLWKITDQFFREYFRSGNVFLYRLYAEFNREELSRLKNMSLANVAKRVPLKYLLLNPADIEIIAASNFVSSSFVKVLNSFEISSIMTSNKEENAQIFNLIPDLKNLKNNIPGKVINLPLLPDRLITVFYKKQDYEPMAVPMGFPVLEDINWKAELKKIDMAISRTIQQAVLLITAGDKDIGPPSPAYQEALRKIFANESVGRVLISDYTTDAKFVIPDIGQILDPKKYEVVDRDIRFGLNNILFGEEKFANSSTKMDAFFERLKYGRTDFMNNFLIPEIEYIGREMGFKRLPQPRWTTENFENNSAVLSRVYTQMLQLGAITPEEAIEAIRDNRLPIPDELIENQIKFKENRDKGYFQPLLNQTQATQSPSTGRPVGQISQQRKTIKKPAAPIGKKTEASVDTYVFSTTKLKEILKEKEELEFKIFSTLKEKYHVKELNEQQEKIGKEICNIIIGSQEKSSWDSSINIFIENPGTNTIENEVTRKIFDIAEYHIIDCDTAALLYHSRICQEV